jgi:hypothetical protein
MRGVRLGEEVKGLKEVGLVVESVETVLRLGKLGLNGADKQPQGNGTAKCCVHGNDGKWLNVPGKGYE